MSKIDLDPALAAALGGGPERHHQKTAEQGKLPVRERVALLTDEGSFVEDGTAGQLGQGRPRCRRCGDRDRNGRRPDDRADGQRPDGEGRVVGTEDRREDPADPGAGPEARGSDGLPGRLGRCPDHRSGPDVPRTPRGGPDLLQRGADVREGAAGLPAVRPERRRRRLHPRLLRRGDHARRATLRCTSDHRVWPRW